ncbi:MAG: hypothetical protein ACRBBP_04375 [Bdellovibrionales bacterium]
MAFFGIFSFFTPSQKIKDSTKSHKEPGKAITKDDHSDHQHEHHSAKNNTKNSIDRTPTNSAPKVVFSYKNEVAKVQKLSKNLPESKAELIDLIKKADPFKEEGRSVKPHTSDELTQRKIGAVKVLALKALVTNETQKDILKRDLINISRNALDPTIRQIAKASLESEEKGRSLHDDFNEAIPVQMPE